MLFIKDKDRFYIIESTKIAGTEGDYDQMLVPENMPFFKVKNSNTVIACMNCADLDALRYRSFPFPAELSLPAIHNKIMQKVIDIWDSLGRADEDGDTSALFFAKKDRAFASWPNGTISELETAEAYGWREEYFRYALDITEGMPLKERIKAVYKAVGEITSSNLFPLIMINTKDFKIEIVEEKK